MLESLPLASIAVNTGWTQAAFAIGTVTPFLFHRTLASRWAKHELPPLRPIPSQSDQKMPFITLVLPTWNEGLIIEGKLNGISAQEYPRDRLEVIIIDAASDDDTMQLVRGWMESHRDGDLADRIKIIIEEERKGKSFSINRAFAAAREEAEVLMMSDVDCRLTPGSLMHVGRRFLDSNIGALTGRQVLLNPDQNQKTEEEATYRDTFTLFRIGESAVDSTPIFHGECAAYRKTALAGHKLIEGANADDSQMAVAVRRNGPRAIYDPELVFKELAPPDSEAQNIQKVRRAQGLVRHFWRNRDTWFRYKFGKFGWTMGAQGWMHIVAPWLMVFGILAGLGCMMTAIPAYGLLPLLSFSTGVPMLLSILVWTDLLVLALLFSASLRLPVPLSGVASTFFVYMLVLLRAQVLIIRGRSLHRWQQVSAVREALAELERTE